MSFFEDVTWGQIIAAAGVAAILSILTTLVVEYIAKPTLEVRKHKKLRDETQIDEILFKFAEMKAALALVVEFDKFRPNGSIIPTYQNLLSQQLKHVCVASELTQQQLARLTKKYQLSEAGMKEVHELVASIEAAALKTRSNIDVGDYKEFKGRNQGILSKYLPKIDKVVKHLENKA